MNVFGLDVPAPSSVWYGCMITAPRSPQYAFSVPIMSWKFTRRRLRIVLDGNMVGMEKDVLVSRVDAYKTKSGNTRFVLRDEDGNEYTTFKEEIARQAVAAEGRRARIEFHEQQRNGFTNVYLDRVEPLEEAEEGAPRHGRGRVGGGGRGGAVARRHGRAGSADPSEGALRAAEAVPGRGRRRHPPRRRGVTVRDTPGAWHRAQLSGSDAGTSHGAYRKLADGLVRRLSATCPASDAGHGWTARRGRPRCGGGSRRGTRTTT